MIRILESSFLTSAVDRRGYPDDGIPDIAFAGRSNVGKSSMINTLLSRKLLARISGRPGKTRLVNFLHVRYRYEPEGADGVVRFVDLPGYGFAHVSQGEREKWRRMMQEYFAKRKQLKGVVMLTDIRHPADPKDMMLLEMLAGRPVLVVATKADKEPKTKVPGLVRELARAFGVPVTPFSSHLKTGTEPVLEWIERRLEPEPAEPENAEVTDA
jgi:GTP-binding protein